MNLFCFVFGMFELSKQKLSTDIVHHPDVHIHAYKHTHASSHIHKITYTHRIFTYTQTHIHTCICTHPPMHPHIYANSHTHMHTYTLMHPHIYTNSHTHMHTHTHPCVLTYTQTHVHTCIHIHTHASSHIHKLTPFSQFSQNTMGTAFTNLTFVEESRHPPTSFHGRVQSWSTICKWVSEISLATLDLSPTLEGGAYLPSYKCFHWELGCFFPCFLTSFLSLQFSLQQPCPSSHFLSPNLLPTFSSYYFIAFVTKLVDSMFKRNPGSNSSSPPLCPHTLVCATVTDVIGSSLS